MWKPVILSVLFVGVVVGGRVYDYHQEQEGGEEVEYQQHVEQPEYHHQAMISDDHGSESEHHSEVNHEHATSHQSFKMHHFHPVPVYIKKEDQHFLKHPVEISNVNHKHKLIHPETQHSHGHGLTLEEHNEFENYKLLDHHGYQQEEEEQPSYGHVEESHDFPEYLNSHHHQQ